MVHYRQSSTIIYSKLRSVYTSKYHCVGWSADMTHYHSEEDVLYRVDCLCENIYIALFFS